MSQPEILPFRALRFTRKAGDPANLLSPPYDVINDAQQKELLARAPYNVVRIEKPDEGDGSDAYARAATTLATWKKEGVLARDGAASLYLHEHRFSVAGKSHTRTGFYGLVRIEPHHGGAIKPHEAILPTPLADRVAMLRGLNTQVSPVFAMYRGPALPTPDASPDLDFAVGGEGHRLWCLSDPADVEAIVKGVKGSLYIADGHHRYAAGRAWRDELKEKKQGAWTGSEPENFSMMAMVPTADLVVLATHRLIRPRTTGPDMAEVRARLKQVFTLEEVALADLAAKVATAGHHGTAFGLAGFEPGRGFVMVAKKADIAKRMPVGKSAPWRELDVAILGEIVLDQCFNIDGQAVRTGAIGYTPDASEALAALDSGSATSALLLNPTRVEQVLAVADAEDAMPQKSTYFYPKLPTGLTIHPFD